MAQVVLQPALNRKAQEHFDNTVRNPVSLQRICRFVGEDECNALRELYPDGTARVWGIVPGAQNTTYYRKMEPGAWTLFYRREDDDVGRYFAASPVTRKLDSADRLARELWPDKDEDQETWRHVYFLGDLQWIRVPHQELWQVHQWHREDFLPRVGVLGSAASRRVLDYLDLPQEPLQEREPGSRKPSGGEEAPSGGQGYSVSPEVRRAVELHAMRQAEAYYRAQGFDVKDVSGTESFDLLCTRDGSKIYVEVKGTQTAGETVELTANEASLEVPEGAERHLFVQSNVQVKATDPPEALYGESRVFYGWSPESDDLRPLRFEYQVPDWPEHYGGKTPFFFPWPDVEDARKNRQLQRQHDAQGAQKKHEDKAKPCPLCNRESDELDWFYFSSPESTWEMLAGRGGWMSVCDDCHVQVDFFLEVMS